MKSEIDIWWAGWLFHHQRQIEMVGSVCNAVDKVLQGAHKFYRLRTQQGPVAASTLKQSCIVHHIWWLLESFCLQPISSWFGLQRSALPSSGLIGTPVPQQLTNPGLSCAILYRMLWVLGLSLAWHQLPHLVCLLIPQDLEWEMWTSLLKSSNYSKNSNSKKLSFEGNNSSNSYKSNSCSPLRCSKASNFDSLEPLQCLR